MRDFDPTASEFITSGYLANSRPGGLLYDIGTMFTAGASLLGSAMSSGSASDAAEGQAKASADSNALQKYMYDNNVKLQQPAMDAGNTARNRLMQLLGLGGGSAAPDRASILAQIKSSSPAPTQGTPGSYDYSQPGWAWTGGEDAANIWTGPGPAPMIGATDGNSSNYESQADAEYARQMQAYQASQSANASDPSFGSLTKNFTGADLASEPGYQFGLNEGNKALDRRAASGGNYFSGAALKGATRYAQDYAGTKYGEAYNRDAANKDRTVNYLNGVISPGMSATTQAGNAGTNYANTVGNTLTNQANASGAAGIASSNAISNGLSSAAGSYNQNQLMQKILGGGSGSGYGSNYGTSNSWLDELTGLKK